MPSSHAAEATADQTYEQRVNPQWVRLLDILQMNVRYDRCEGAELFTSDGRRILDFLSGYCVHNAGHNHPRIIAALKDELDRRGPAMLAKPCARTRRSTCRAAMQRRRWPRD